jgi:hypothetical protein
MRGNEIVSTDGGESAASICSLLALALGAVFDAICFSHVDHKQVWETLIVGRFPSFYKMLLIRFSGQASFLMAHTVHTSVPLRHNEKCIIKTVSLDFYPPM